MNGRNHCAITFLFRPLYVHGVEWRPFASDMTIPRSATAHVAYAVLANMLAIYDLLIMCARDSHLYLSPSWLRFLINRELMVKRQSYFDISL